MDKLTDLIVNKLGEKAISELPDMFARGWSIPLDSSLKDEVRLAISLEGFLDVKKLVHKISERKSEYTGNRRTSLAARIPDHNLGNIQFRLHSDVEMLANRVGKSQYATQEFKEGDLVEDILKDMMPYRSFCLAMAYLASGGDNRFTSYIPVGQIQHFLQGSNNYKFEFKADQNDHDSILIPEYISLLEIVKNAPLAPVVRYGIRDKYAFIQIQDSGQGIRNKDGTPLSPEKLHEIFGEFSTREKGGLGLQVAKELVHLRGGHIVVETRAEGEQTFSYSTKTKTVKEVHLKEKGTTFEIYLPKVQ